MDPRFHSASEFSKDTFQLSCSSTLCNKKNCGSTGNFNGRSTEPAQSTVELSCQARDFGLHRAAKPALTQVGMGIAHSSLQRLLLKFHSVQDVPGQQQDLQSFEPVELFLRPLLIEFPARHVGLRPNQHFVDSVG